MIRKSLRPYYLMGALIALFLAVTAGAGVLDGDLYWPFLSEPIVAFQFFQDLVSLIFAPVLLLAIYYSRRGSARAFVLWTGILVYVLYYYSFYVFDFVYTVFYPLYLALIGLATFSLIGLLTGVDPEWFRQRIKERMPVRLIAVVLGTTLLFVPIWLRMLAKGIAAGQPRETDLVFIFDLPFLIPACLFATIQIWQRRPVGYLLSGPLLFKSVTSGLLLTGGEVLKMQRGLPPAIDQLAMYLFLGIVGSLGLLLYLQNIQEQEGRQEEPAQTGALRTTGRA
ncbi:MAG: hypothetical protein M3220_16620 [Chloroflexota bacterium]|nr:hypothetical protein [Chloroflexota bacterium]